ncbi:MAG: PAS domain S-box-containing protein [Enterobacterales bacterium]|jgi:PAS domain S-box-containing protein
MQIINKIKNSFYFLPLRMKLILVSGTVISITIVFSIYFLNIFSELTLKDQYSSNLRSTIQVINHSLASNPSSDTLKELIKIEFIEKITVFDPDGNKILVLDSKDYDWDQLEFFTLDIADGGKEKKIIIALNRDKYLALNKVELSRFKDFMLYITSLVTLLIILIVNLLVIAPIDSISVKLDEYINDDDDDDYIFDEDDKSRSEILELSKTIGVLKRNIAQKRIKEAQLLTMQTRLSSVLNTIGDAIITINKKNDIVMVNPAFEKIWGHFKKDVIGKSLATMMPEKYREMHQAGLDKYLATGVGNVINQNLELEALHADGHVFPIEIHISETIINDDIYFTAAIRDITQRKKTEKELLEAKENVEEKLEEKTQDLVSRINELNCLYGLSTLIEHSNKNLNYVLKELLKLICKSCKYPDIVSCLIRYAGHEYKTKNYKQTQWQLKQDIRIKNKNKGYISLCYLEENYPDSENQFLKYERNILDVVCVRLSRYLDHIAAENDLKTTTETLKETQLQLIQAVKLDTIGTLSAGVAHEVKNPLAVIQLGIDYLSKKIKGNEHIELIIHEMDEAITRADSVIKELVNFSASADLSFEKLDVNKLIDDSLNLVRHEILKNDIRIIKKYHQDLHMILGDKQKLGQVIINIIMNAIHAMETSPVKSITINTLPSTLAARGLDITGKFSINENIIAIMIEDTGIGIDKDNLNKLFEPFFSTKPAGKGAGLGLTVCQNIIRLHGGKIVFANSDTGGAIAEIIFQV